MTGILQYLDRFQKPPESDLSPGQVWAWMGGATPPHWEIKGTGVIVAPGSVHDPDFLPSEGITRSWR